MLQEKEREDTINTETYKIIKKTNKHPIITGIIKAIIIIFLLLFHSCTYSRRICGI